MSIIVNTNVQSLIAQRNLNKATTSLNDATVQLSTGVRINEAADDAAGLFIAKGLESQLRGAQQCVTNISLGINVMQIAEGDLSTIADNVMRIKDLATQAATGIYSTDARDALTKEAVARYQEIDRVAKACTFNGLTLLDGQSNLLSDGLRLQVGAGADPDSNSITIENVFTASTASALGLGSTTATVTSAFSSTTAAAAFIQTCEEAITAISEKRANIGAVQSRLEMTSDGLATTIQNISSAKSTFMDTDIAAATAEYTKSQILQQISTSMLLQANQAPTAALSLLQ